MSERDKLAQWYELKVKKGPVEVDLLHERGDHVETFEAEENEEALHLIDRIFEAATEDAKGHTGPQRYWMNLREAGTKEKIGRKNFTVDGELYEKGLGSEAADAYGLQSQTMRHLEAVLKQFGQTFQQTTMNMQREHERMAAQLAEHSRLEIERMAMSRQLAHDVAQQRIEEEKIKAQAARDAWWQRQVEILLPLGAKKLLGQGGEKAEANWSKETDTLLRLVTLLRPDQKERMMLVFDPPARIAIGAIAQGELGEFAPLAIQRIMSALTEEQYHAMYKILDTAEQKQLFSELHDVRRHGIEWAEGKALEAHPPMYLPQGQSNGTVEGKGAPPPEAPKEQAS